MQNFMYLDDQLVNNTNTQKTVNKKEKEDKINGTILFIVILILIGTGATFFYLMRHHDQVMLSFEEVSGMLKG